MVMIVFVIPLLSQGQALRSLSLRKQGAGIQRNTVSPAERPFVLLDAGPAPA